MSLREKEEVIWSSKGMQSVSQYISSPAGNKRSKWFANQLKQYQFSSIYEVGVFGGRNLSRILYNFPKVTVGGLDINKIGIDVAKERIPGGQFDHLSAFDIDKVFGSWDVIFTVGVAIHLAPDLIYDFAKKATKKANKYIFHMEQIGNNVIINGPAELNPTKKR